MTPKEAIWMCGQAKLHAQHEQWWAEVKKWQQIAALIESLQSERDALAFRVVQMREELLNCQAYHYLGGVMTNDKLLGRINAVLALTPTAADRAELERLLRAAAERQKGGSK